ncbi:MAG: ComEC/Rec2 family competence protein [Candidatus Sulfotelmatobacter sp.]
MPPLPLVDNPPVLSTKPEFQPKPPRQPMLWAALSYALGIVAGVHAWRPASWWVAAAVAFLAAGLYFVRKRKWLGVSLALGAFFLAGALHIQLRGPVDALDPSLQPFEGQPVVMTAHVTRDGKLREGAPNEIRQSLDVETEEIVTENGQPIPIHSGVRLGIYSTRPEAIPQAPASPAIHFFHYGERLRLPVKLKLPRNFRNPGAFDYQGYLTANGISALGSAKAEDVEVLPGFAGNRVELWRSRIHASIIAKVHALWPPPQAALIDAMVIGEEAFIDRDTRVDFQRSGTYHILVVSGMNVTILAFVAFWTLRRLRLTEVPATVLTILLCVAYAFLTEVGAPVWRATLMCAIYLGTRLLYRDRAMVNALGAAALGLLVFDPRQLFTASFQMTFLCVLIVAAIGLPLIERTSRLYRQALTHWDADDYGPSLPPQVAQFRLDLRLLARQLARFIGDHWSLRLTRTVTIIFLATFELLLVSAVMQMGLALPMAYYFHRATTIGLPANVAVVPLTQLLMPAAILTIALGYISPVLAKLPALLRPAIHHRNGPRSGRPAPGRSSRSHTLTRNDGSSVRRAGLSDVVRSPPRPSRLGRNDCPAPSLASLSLRPPEAANARRTSRSNVHRRRGRRLHPAGNAARPHLANRRRRPHLGRGLPTRLRRRCGRSLPLDPPHLPTGRSGPSPTATPTTSAACPQC